MHPQNRQGQLCKDMLIDLEKLLLLLLLNKVLVWKVQRQAPEVCGALSRFTSRKTEGQILKTSPCGPTL